MPEEQADTVFIGIDDTDNETSIGTGKLARILAESLQSRNIGISQGVTRHQLYLHPDIPYTSHNSAAACALVNAQPLDVLEFCSSFLQEHLQPGADPGLCVCNQEANDLELFGRLVQKEIVTKEFALDVADFHNCPLREIGGTGLGIIGALAAVGLRASGNDGRFLDFGGCRQIEGSMSVEQLRQAAGVATVQTPEGEKPSDNEIVDTQDWVRPELQQGRPVILIERQGDQWQTIRERKPQTVQSETS